MRNIWGNIAERRGGRNRGLATRGLDLPKSNWAQRLDTPPFVAYPVTGGITFTFGGVRIDPDTGGVEELTIGDGLIAGPLLPSITDDGIWFSALDGSHIVVLLTRGGEARASHQHIFVLGDEIVKVRTTFAPDEDRTKRMERFIEALLRGMVRGEDEVEA